jgi:hypothetical protein
VKLVFLQAASAQIIDFDAFAAMKKELPDTFKFDGSIAFDISFEKQARQINRYKTEASMAIQKKDHLLFPILSQAITTSDADALQNSGYLSLKYFKRFQKPIFYEALVQFQWEAQRGLQQRALIGGNLWFNLIRSEEIQFAIACGLIDEYEVWDYTAVDDQDMPEVTPDAIHNTFIKYNAKTRFVWKWDKSAALSLSLFVQGRPDFTEYLRIAPSASLLFQLYKNLHFSVGFEGIYDFEPIVPIDNFFFSQDNSLIFRF